MRAQLMEGFLTDASDSDELLLQPPGAKPHYGFEELRSVRPSPMALLESFR